MAPTPEIPNENPASALERLKMEMEKVRSRQKQLKDGDHKMNAEQVRAEQLTLVQKIQSNKTDVQNLKNRLAGQPEQKQKAEQLEQEIDRMEKETTQEVKQETQPTTTPSQLAENPPKEEEKKGFTGMLEKAGSFFSDTVWPKMQEVGRTIQKYFSALIKPFRAWLEKNKEQHPILYTALGWFALDEKYEVMTEQIKKALRPGEKLTDEQDIGKQSELLQQLEGNHIALSNDEDISEPLRKKYGNEKQGFFMYMKDVLSGEPIQSRSLSELIKLSEDFNKKTKDDAKKKAEKAPPSTPTTTNAAPPAQPAQAAAPVSGPTATPSPTPQPAPAAPTQPQPKA